jgi:hypothetical protein
MASLTYCLALRLHDDLVGGIAGLSATSASLEPLRDLLEEFWPDALGRLKRVVEEAHARETR